MGHFEYGKTRSLMGLVAALVFIGGVAVPGTALAEKAPATSVVFQDHYSTATLTEVRGNRDAVTVTSTYPWPDPYANVQISLSDGTTIAVHLAETVLLPRRTEIVSAYSAYDSALIYGEESKEFCSSAVCVQNDYGCCVDEDMTRYACWVSVLNYSGSPVTATLYLDSEVYGTITAAEKGQTQVLFSDAECPSSATVEPTP